MLRIAGLALIFWIAGMAVTYLLDRLVCWISDRYLTVAVLLTLSLSSCATCPPPAPPRPCKPIVVATVDPQRGIVTQVDTMDLCPRLQAPRPAGTKA